MTRLPGAIWRPISINYTNRRRAYTNACINHVDAGNATTLFGWFNNPDARASSHLFVKRGTPAQIANGERADIEQYVDLDLISWCNAKGDQRAVTVETAGYASGEWDPAQQLALIYIWQQVNALYGVPLTLMTDSKTTTVGIGYHLLGVPATAAQKAAQVSQTGGELWSSSVGKVCPGPDRIRQMPALVTRANQSITQEDDTMSAEGEKALIDKADLILKTLGRIDPRVATIGNNTALTNKVLGDLAGRVRSLNEVDPVDAAQLAPLIASEVSTVIVGSLANAAAVSGGLTLEGIRAEVESAVRAVFAPLAEKEA